MVVAVSCSPQPLGPVVPSKPIERKMIGFLEKFDRWDEDGNGELDLKEIEIGKKSVKREPNEKRYTAAQVVEFYDTDRSGTVSLSEAQAGYRRSGELKPPQS
jgi:Ca2+-binding EF-hand superfamily protein